VLILICSDLDFVIVMCVFTVLGLLMDVLLQNLFARHLNSKLRVLCNYRKFRSDGIIGLVMEKCVLEVKVA